MSSHVKVLGFVQSGGPAVYRTANFSVGGPHIRSRSGARSLAPRASGPSGLEARPTIFDFATPPLTLAYIITPRTCEDKTQGYHRCAPSLSQART